MKITRLLPLIAILSLHLPVLGQSDSKNMATSPAPHPGKEASHAKFNEVSKQGKAQLVFLGDSITAGWNGRGKKAWDQYWAPMQAVNFGIGGDRTEHILWRLQNGNYDGLKPKLTVLMIGTNNTGHEGRAMPEHGDAIYKSSAEQTAQGVTDIIKLLKKKQPQMKILLLAIFPRGADNNNKMRQQNQAANKIIAKLDDDKTVFFLDINQAFLQADGTLSKDIMPDLLHPNAAGYEIWSKGIMDKVKQLMAD
ncbi:MAG: GDSL-type esterase/lipase family protein [Verrucomicrobiales bacterium]|nr:GDSL-type esterase/lipase family protein [Verrucomicrobiales bacterium]